MLTFNFSRFTFNFFICDFANFFFFILYVFKLNFYETMFLWRVQTDTYRTASRLQLETEIMARSITMQLAGKKIGGNDEKVDKNESKVV